MIVNTGHLDICKVLGHECHVSIWVWSVVVERFGSHGVQGSDFNGLARCSNFGVVAPMGILEPNSKTKWKIRIWRRQVGPRAFKWSNSAYRSPREIYCAMSGINIKSPAYGCAPSCGEMWINKRLWMQEGTRAHWPARVLHLNLVADDGSADGRKFCFSLGYSSELDEG